MVRLGRVDGRRRILVDRTVDAPAEDVWEILTDTERWPEWGPSVRGVTASERVIQRGTTGRVETPVGVSVPFEITRCEPYVWEWEVARIPATGHRVESLSGDRCRVTLDLPPLAAGYVPVCRRALDRIAGIAAPN
ncbi:SRPBCC family protein [Halapricum sp. CBA1109]|uniref:SRPBCC family protein n=1 Tax=Halapricum sp. CBA1109 TaxID=2668068 RepID=UPI0012FCEDCC|nr:SRPBCC family protein [Halapricum sp. CBA1109]MUV89304.1 SRPBCC family protein [Halapricum sp. CBA1109]